MADIFKEAEHVEKATDLSKALGAITVGVMLEAGISFSELKVVKDKLDAFLKKASLCK